MDLCCYTMGRKSVIAKLLTTGIDYYSWVNLSILFPMKIAITQRQSEINGVTHDCLDPAWYTMLSSHELIPVPNLIGLDIQVDMLIFSGGDNSKARSLAELICWSSAMKKEIPVLGVCHGAFLLNYLHDGLNKEVTGHRNIGHTIEMENKTHTVNSFHDVGIYTLGKDLETVAIGMDGSCEAFKHRDKNIWGLVWHPERMEIPVFPKDLSELLL